jgi:hypothetical protein
MYRCQVIVKYNENIGIEGIYFPVSGIKKSKERADEWFNQDSVVSVQVYNGVGECIYGRYKLIS